MLEKVKKIIFAVAPALASALGGPLAGTAVNALSSVIFDRPDASEEEIGLSLERATPELLAKIKQADQEFSLALKALDCDLEKTYLSDVADARDKNSQNSSVFWLGVVILFIFLITITMVMVLASYQKINEPYSMILSAIIGYVSSNATQVVSYFFGSSRGSQEKNTALHSAILKK